MSFCSAAVHTWFLVTDPHLHPNNIRNCLDWSTAQSYSSPAKESLSTATLLQCLCQAPSILSPANKATYHWGALPATVVHALGLGPQGQRAPPLGAAHPPHNSVQHLDGEGHNVQAGNNVDVKLLPPLPSSTETVHMMWCITAHLELAPAWQGSVDRASSSTLAEVASLKRLRC